MLATGVLKKKDKRDKVQKSGRISKKIKVKAIPKATSTLPKPKDQRVKTETEIPQEIKKRRNVLPSKSVKEDQIKSCVKAVLKLSEHTKATNKIFEDETAIFAQINCIKIQSTKGNVSFVLPHSTVSSTGEVCLITPDLKKGKKIDHEPSVDHWEEQLQKAGVTNIKTVLPMRQLRVEYDQFELKRRLLTQHDFIMVDTRVLNHVSHLLGKMFFKKHNMLIPVRVKSNEKLKKSIDIGLRTAILRLGVGDCSTILVGHTGMTKTQLKENVEALLQQLKDKFPGGETNIRSISLKLPLSLSVPLYLTLRSPNTISVPKLIRKKSKSFRVVEDELSTIPGSRVSVAPDGTIHMTKRRVKDSDSDMEEDNQNADVQSEEENSD